MNMTMQDNCRLISEIAEKKIQLMIREPNETFTYPYLTPGSVYAKVLWDWDAVFLGISFGPGPYATYLEGSVRNFLDWQEPDGFIPYNLHIDPSKNRVPGTSNPAKPLLAQALVIALRFQGKEVAGQPWVTDAYEGLKRFLGYWQTYHTSPQGFITLKSWSGVGIDNLTTVYGRPPLSTGLLLHNCFIFQEFAAMEKIAKALNRPEEAASWASQRDAQRALLETHAWDPIDGLYYDQDVLSRTPEKVTQEVTWTLPLKIRFWSSFMPLALGIASKARAEEVKK
jgi:putative isomerase